MRKSRSGLGVLMASGIAVYVNSMFGSEPLGGDKQQCGSVEAGGGCEVLLPRTDAALSKTVTVAGKNSQQGGSAGMVFVRNPDGSVANTTATKHIDPERVVYSVREPVFIGEFRDPEDPSSIPPLGKPVDVGVFKDPEDIKSMPRLLEPVEIGEYKNPET